MESRKIQKVGYSTLTVSLPSEWVKRNSIKQGDLVFLIPERDGTLKITPGQIAQREEADEYIINSDECDEEGLLERIIVGCYILGRDVIRITSTTRIGKEHVDEVRATIRKLIGLGILEETPKSILLQCSVDTSKFKLDMLIRRLAIISSTILSEAMQALSENTKTLAEEAIKREDEADTIYYLAVRLLLSAQTKPEVAEQIGVTDPVFIPAMRVILQYLELAADYSEDTAKKVIGLEAHRSNLADDVVQRIYHFGEMALAILQKSVDCVFSQDPKIANGLIEMKYLLETESERFMLEAPVIPFLRAIITGLNMVADKGATIADIAINRALERPGKQIENIIRTKKHVRSIQLDARKKLDEV